ncbi:MAG: hypothetical protein KAJ86_00225 [Alphaproteobacteria bacterium]|nr:hypothetical protein [Alphaproteobacteria bacterium]
MSNFITAQPGGSLDDKPHSELAGQLLKDAADFFKTLGEQNEPIKEQMDENAKIYEQISSLVMQDPLGILD